MTTLRTTRNDPESPPVSASRLSHSAAPWTKAKAPSNHHGVRSDADPGHRDADRAEQEEHQPEEEVDVVQLGEEHGTPGEAAPKFCAHSESCLLF